MRQHHFQQIVNELAGGVDGGEPERIRVTTANRNALSGTWSYLDGDTEIVWIEVEIVDRMHRDRDVIRKRRVYCAVADIITVEKFS